VNDIKRKLLYIFLLLHIHPIFADEASIAVNLETSQINEIQESKSKLLKVLLDVFPEGNDAKISESGIQGLYTISIGSQVFYMSQNGKFILQGDIYDAKTGTNLTEQDRISARKDFLNQLNEEEMVIFAPDEFQHTITVFTDVDCGYCRKFHSEIDEVMDLGIRVRYLFFPRTGPDTESWEKAEKVWCSQDRHSAITKAKQGKSLRAKICSETPVQKHYSLGQMFMVQGTPTMVSDKGKTIIGYLPAGVLKDRLESDL
jgi:thiol:disulfide interchange protein DsbC